jgi:magnesium transporter
MLCVRKSSDEGLELIETIAHGSWVNVIDPKPDEVEKLTSMNIPLDWIANSLDVDERPRTEREDDGKIFILIRIPTFNGIKTDIPYSSIPLGIILTEQAIITVCKWEHEILLDFINGKVKGFSTGKRNRFVLHLLFNTAAKYLYFLREINKIVESVEDKLQASMKNKEVLELLKYQKSLVYFATALKSNELLMERLQRSQLFRMYPDDEDLLEDVITENQQAIEMVNISSNILTSMMDAFASIISNNLNVVMKLLTSMTIVMSVPTIVTSFFGMNVNLPFSDHPFAYLIVIGIFLGVSLIVVTLFVRKNWF